jgi:hypothetical protein
MKSYKIVAVFWEDHIHIERSQMIHKPSDAFVMPTLSVGILYKEDDKALILMSDIERYEDRDEASYTVILKSTIINRKIFGSLKLKSLR